MIAELITLSELIEETKLGYVEYSKNNSIRAKKSSFQINQTSIVINAPGYLPNYSMITIKVNSKSNSNSAIGLPFLMGTILLLDQKTGQLLALFDSSLITAMRTGAAGAIGVQCMARSNTSRIALIGAGVQGEWQIRALHSIGRVSHVNIFDTNLQNAIKLSNTLTSALGIPTTVVNSPKEAIDFSDIVILVTQSKTPIITNEMLHPGLHINAFGADQPGKVELATDVILKNYMVVDDRDLAVTDGVLNVAYNANPAAFDKQYAEIGELIKNKNLEVTSNDGITIFGNVGLAFQDLVACSIIYRNALKFNKGVWVDFDTSEAEDFVDNSGSSLAS